MHMKALSAQSRKVHSCGWQTCRSGVEEIAYTFFIADVVLHIGINSPVTSQVWPDENILHGSSGCRTRS